LPTYGSRKTIVVVCLAQMNEPKAVDSENSLKQLGQEDLTVVCFSLQISMQLRLPHSQALAGSDRSMVSSAPHQGV
jgi:hypothetical protein